MRRVHLKLAVGLCGLLIGAVLVWAFAVRMTHSVESPETDDSATQDSDLPTGPQGSPETPRAQSARIPKAGAIVRVLDIDLPIDRSQSEDVLWHLESGSPPVEQGFPPFEGKNWKRGFQERREAIVEAARSLGLDPRSLDASLAKVLKHAEQQKLAYLPVKAYRIRQGSKPVWVLVVDWEERTWVARGEPLSHTRFFAYDARSLELVDFTTCK